MMLVLALMGYILKKIFQMTYEAHAYWNPKGFSKMKWEIKK